MTNEPPDPRSSMWAWIAYALRWNRVERGETGDTLAKTLNCARSTISRLETGEAKLADGQAAKIDKLWRTGGFFTIALWYARLGHDPNWMKSFGEFERRATAVYTYSGQLVPALLQTPDYARAVLMAGRPKDLEGTLAKRMGRQALLERPDPPELSVLLSESVLDLPIGGPAVMRAQLQHLLDMSERFGIVVRVVPREAGAHEGLDGPFKIFRVREGDVGFVEAPTGGRLVPEADEVRELHARFERIGHVALPVQSSRKLIRSLMEGMV
ncbi:helix-turn-helix transcriptional regulator [Spirillospora sp. NPDC029432]|uniref:helix-turn-helix domain-containing protein n=1 Tax=Spirillospora sp. NPDC029432 TaxID=3154599 RepID=UPI0034549FD3